MSAQTKIRSINPATNEVLGEVEVSSPDQVHAAVAKAKKAQPAWNALGVTRRAEILQRLHDDLFAHKDELSTLISQEMGHPIARNSKSVEGAIKRMQWNIKNAPSILAAETTYEDDKELHQIHYEPFGVFGVIAPWNYPLSNFGMTAVQPLLAGNTVIYKLSEEVPLFGQALNEAFARAKIPEGIFTQVFGAGDIGEIIAYSDIDHLHFTGSTAIGHKLYQIAAERFIPLTLELGGSDAGIVFEDADIDSTVESIFWDRFDNAGQTCCALKRLYIHESRYDELTKKLTDFVRKQKIGSPLESDTIFGPLVSEKQKKLLTEQVEDALGKGAKVLLNANDKSKMPHAYFGPILLTDLTQEMHASREELFGPVLPIAKFKTEDEAIRLANNTNYGLSAYVFTKDRARYARVASQLQAGGISHNGVSYFNPANPFGGYKRSGLGRSCGKIGMQSCCQIKVITTAKN